MGGEKRRMEMGLGPRALHPGQQIQVDLKSATQKVCKCGCIYFIPAVTAYTVSALLSPTGKELPVQVPVLVCMECKKDLHQTETS